MRPTMIRLFLLCAAAAMAATCARPAQAPVAPPAFDLEEATIADLQRRMDTGQDTARSLVDKYLARIAAIDQDGPTLKSVIEINPEATAIADALDAERKAKGPRGPLHGIPVLIKDNIATADRMQTTAGSLALEGVRPPEDAFIVTRLRAAGAVILGKTNLSEWANFRSTHSTSGWSGRGGLTRLPYALDRNPSGSSSGSGAAAAANLAALTVGTETDGSITSPANNSGLVGVKPTLGLVSRHGIVPIAHSQDTAGPMTRTVADAAAMMPFLSRPDARDFMSLPPQALDYASLDSFEARGLRIGYLPSMGIGEQQTGHGIPAPPQHSPTSATPAQAWSGWFSQTWPLSRQAGQRGCSHSASSGSLETRRKRIAAPVVGSTWPAARSSVRTGATVS